MPLGLWAEIRGQFGSSAVGAGFVVPRSILEWSSASLPERWCDYCRLGCPRSAMLVVQRLIGCVVRKGGWVGRRVALFDLNNTLADRSATFARGRGRSLHRRESTRADWSPVMSAWASV